MSPTPPSGFSAQLTDVLIKVLITGSGGSAIYFLYVNELPKAAIAALIAAGASLLTAFGEGLMGQLKGGMQRRGAALGAATDQAVEGAMARTWAKLSGVHKQYHRALQSHCYALEVEGFQDLPGLALEDVFVPLRVESDQNPWGEANGPQEIWRFLPRRDQPTGTYLYRRIVILAAPGYGKTTLLRHLTLTFVTQPPESVRALMPILLRFRETYPLMRRPQDDPGSDRPMHLPELVVRHLRTQAEFSPYASLAEADAWFTDQLQGGHCLVMLDGLDEVPSLLRPEVRQWVDQQMKRYPRTQFILTSRPHGFELQPDDPSPAIAVDLKLRVLDFTPNQKQAFVEKWYHTVFWRMKWERLWQDSLRRPEAERLTEAQARLKSTQEAQDSAADLVRQIVNSPSLNDLARNPLLITMIASTHRAKTVLPKRRVELYDKIFDLLLGTRPYAKRTTLTLTASECRAVLQALAWHLAMEEITQFSPAQGEIWIAEPLKRCLKDRALSPAQFWREMTEVAGLLVEKELGRYEFAHQTFQEYLAAKYLRECGPEGEAFLLEKLDRDRWQEIVRFYAALGDATAIINALLTAEVTEYSLLLARRCMEEGREIDQAALARLQTLVETFTAQALNPIQATNNPVLSKLRADLRLQQRFSTLTPLTETTAMVSDRSRAIAPTFITWGEYELFLQTQDTGQFHSQAKRLHCPQGQESEPVQGISWEDARWFCAWLSTQTSLKKEGRVFSYRLPTGAELRDIDFYASMLRGSDDESAIVALSTNFYDLPRPWTERPTPPGNAILVVREELPRHYETLVNYLANCRWAQADRETEALMIAIAERQELGSLRVEDIREFPCEDLRILDQLWVQFSGGHFGFSVQRQIYVEMGNALIENQCDLRKWHQFCEATGWRLNGTVRQYADFEFSLEAPWGHLPGPLWSGASQDQGLAAGTLGSFLFSRARACGL